jgi:hypothetical protein
MARCSVCEEMVDTDEDVNFYDLSYTTKSGYDGHCENCREDIIDRMSNAQQEAYEKQIYG